MRTTHANRGARPHHCWSPATFNQTAAKHLCAEMFVGFGGCPSSRPITSVLPVPGDGRHRCWLPSSEPLVRSSWLNGPIVSCLVGCREAVCRPCQAVSVVSVGWLTPQPGGPSRNREIKSSHLYKRRVHQYTVGANPCHVDICTPIANLLIY